MSAKAEVSVREFATLAWLGGVVALSPLALDMFTPAASHAAADLDMDARALAQSIAVVLAGNAIGYSLCLAGVRSFTGRAIARVGLVGFIIASGSAVFSQTGEALLFWRFAQGLFVIACRFGAQASAAELGGDDEALTRRHADMAAISAVVIVLAPLSGAAFVSLGGWRAVPMSLAVTGAVLLAMDLARRPDRAASRPLSRNPFAGFGDRNVWRFVAIGALSGGHFAIYATFLPVVAQEAGASAIALGVWLATQGAFVLIFRVLHRAALSLWSSRLVLKFLCMWQFAAFAACVASLSHFGANALWAVALGVVAVPAINVNALALSQAENKEGAGGTTGLFGLVAAFWGASIGVAASATLAAADAPWLMLVTGSCVLMLAFWRTSASDLS